MIVFFFRFNTKKPIKKKGTDAVPVNIVNGPGNLPFPGGISNNYVKVKYNHNNHYNNGASSIPIYNNGGHQQAATNQVDHSSVI